MESSTSRSTLTTPLPMYSIQRLSTKSMSIGTSTVQRTRAKQGRSHKRSTLRLRIDASVVDERQLSKVMGGMGGEFGTMVSPQVSQPLAQALQLLQPLQDPHWVQALPPQPQAPPALTWAKLVMVTTALSICSCHRALS